MRIGLKAGQWGWSFDTLEAAWRAAEESGFDLLSCFDHVSGSPGDKTAWDAPTLLATMAARTSRIPLGVHVLNVSIRNPLLLAGQLATVQAASGERLEVGLGAGSHHLAGFDHTVAGIEFPPFERRIERLAACCRAFRRLWGGETVSDELLGLRDATLGPRSTPQPPIVVGGRSHATLEVAARHADGWNASSVDPIEFGRLVGELQRAAEDVGRESTLERQVQVWARDVEVSLLRDLAGRYEDAGADTLIVVLDEERDPLAVLRRVADALI